jgi:hypothetical protein
VTALAAELIVIVGGGHDRGPPTGPVAGVSTGSRVAVTGTGRALPVVPPAGRHGQRGGDSQESGAGRGFSHRRAQCRVLKKISAEVRSWRLHRRTGSSEREIAQLINPKIQGWMACTWSRPWRTASAPSSARSP